MEAGPDPRRFKSSPEKRAVVSRRMNPNRLLPQTRADAYCMSEALEHATELVTRDLCAAQPAPATHRPPDVCPAELKRTHCARITDNRNCAHPRGKDADQRRTQVPGPIPRPILRSKPIEPTERRQQDGARALLSRRRRPEEIDSDHLPSPPSMARPVARGRGPP